MGVLGHARWSAADMAAFNSGRLQKNRRCVGGSFDVIADQSSSSAVSWLCSLLVH